MGKRSIQDVLEDIHDTFKDTNIAPAFTDSIDMVSSSIDRVEEAINQLISVLETQHKEKMELKKLKLMK